MTISDSKINRLYPTKDPEIIKNRKIPPKKVTTMKFIDFFFSALKPFDRIAKGKIFGTRGTERGFFVQTKGGQIRMSQLLEMQLDRFILGQGTQLQAIRDLIINDLNQIDADLYQRFISGSGDESALIKYIAMFDSYLYNAQIASLTNKASLKGEYTLPMDISDPANPKVMLQRLQITIERRGSGKAEGHTNRYLVISDPSHPDPYGIALDPIIERSGIVSNEERFVYIKFVEEGKQYPNNTKKPMMLAFRKANGELSYIRARDRTPAKIRARITEINAMDVGNYLEINQSTGEITSVDLDGILRGKEDFLDELLSLEIMYRSRSEGHGTRTIREQVFGGVDNQQFRNVLKGTNDEYSNLEMNRQVLEAVLNRVIERHVSIGADPEGKVLNPLEYIDSNDVSELERDVANIDKKDFKKSIYQRLVDTLSGNQGGVKRELAVAEGLISAILDRDILGQINSKMKIETLLQKTFIHELGIESRIALDLSQKLLGNTNHKNLTVGQLLAKEVAGPRVSPSEKTGQHVDSYEVALQQIVNGYLLLVRGDKNITGRCDVTTACISFTPNINPVRGAKFKAIVDGINKAGGDPEKAVENDPDLITQDRESWIFFMFLHTAVENSKGIEVSQDALQRAYNVYFGMVTDNGITQQKFDELSTSHNNPQLWKKLTSAVNGNRLLQAGIIGLFGTSQFKHSNVTAQRGHQGGGHVEVPGDITLSKVHYTYQLTGYNIPGSQFDLFRNLDLKYNTLDKNGKSIDADFELKQDDVTSLNPKYALNSSQTAQFNQVHNPHSVNDLIYFETDLQHQPPAVRDRMLDESLEELKRLTPSEFRGRGVNTMRSLLITVSGRHKGSTKALIDLFSTLKNEGSYVGPSGRKIDFNLGQAEFKSRLDAEIEELGNIRESRQKLLNKLPAILVAQTVTR